MTPGFRILLVDDEEAILFAFRQVLKGPRTSVDTAPTVEEAKQLLDRQPYGAMIADLRLTGANKMDGLEVVSYARQAQPACKIIVATAYGDEMTKAHVLDIGADWYFEKPVSPRVVKEKLIDLGVLPLSELSS
jgi:DNA-binding response OmpR family regulator